MTTPVLRGAGVLIALAILYWRFPLYFTHPQFWAEDGIIWRDAYLHGAASAAFPACGLLQH